MFFQPFPADLWPIQVRRWLPVHCVQCREHFGLRDHPPLTGWPVGRSQWVVHSVDMYKDGQAPGTSPTLWKKLKSRNTHIEMTIIQSENGMASFYKMWRMGADRICCWTVEQVSQDHRAPARRQWSECQSQRYDQRCEIWTFRSEIMFPICYYYYYYYYS